MNLIVFSWWRLRTQSDPLPEGELNPGSMPRLFTFVVGDALRVRAMREKMRSSNGRERP